MPNQQVFCNSPWYELHIYWDGALAFCCHATPNVPYDTNLKNKYNIKNMSIREWYDSGPMRTARLKVLGDQRWNHCDRCWHEERVANTSRRHRSNLKSVIFTKQNFTESYQQSPGFEKFEHSRHDNGAYDGFPIDLHIDLGNYCNLACKMCNPAASSRIASQHRQWNMISSVAQDWTADETTWNRFRQELIEIPKLKNIHFMGGETIIQPRFHDLVDFLIEHGKTDVCMSFVTNGTTFDKKIISKLKKFPRVGLEISIETLDELNEYTRQGTDNQVVLKNIQQYINECNGTTITVTLRPAPGLLTVKSYWQVIEYALQNHLLIQSNLCTDPDYLDIPVLPMDIRHGYKSQYQNLIKQYDLENLDLDQDYNERDPNNYRRVAKNQISQILEILDLPVPDNQDRCLKDLVAHLDRWDRVFHFDARKLYPELTEILEKYGYLQNTD
jgi:MoaA/NifB/PqqE/SkfB family radical SAM enzyme